MPGTLSPTTLTTRAWIAVLVIASLAIGPAFGQGRADTEQGRMIEVRRKQVELQSFRAELARKQELFDKGLISGAELDGVRVRLTGAELDYQEAVLALLTLEPRVSVRRALKSQAPDGRRLVQVTLANLTPAFDDSQLKLLSNFEGAAPIPEGLKTRALRDLFVSLRDTGSSDATGRVAGRGITVALPYEVYIPELRYGESRTLAFQLLRDVDSALVTISQKGQVQEIELQLEQAETRGVVQVSSNQISQEADLGGQATFDLRLERSTVDVRSLQLKAVNLPRQISYSFLEPQGDARVSQINFPAGVRQQNLKFRLFLPDRSDDLVKIDQPLAFWVLALGSGEAEHFAGERVYTPDEIKRSRAGTLRLEVIPRGVGKIELATESLFAETDPGQSVNTTFKLRNTGTRRLDNVQLSVEAPMNWRVALTPQTIPALDPHREQNVRFSIAIPADAAVGDYELRIKTQSYAYNRQVPSEDKIFRVSVKARSKIWMTVGVLGTLLLVAAGILVSGIKLARR
jgi:hypothetical protein